MMHMTSAFYTHLMQDHLLRKTFLCVTCSTVITAAAIVVTKFSTGHKSAQHAKLGHFLMQSCIVQNMVNSGLESFVIVDKQSTIILEQNANNLVV